MKKVIVKTKKYFDVIIFIVTILKLVLTPDAEFDLDLIPKIVNGFFSIYSLICKEKAKKVK